jgi:hypothetical protein
VGTPVYGIFRSTDFGDSWFDADTGMPGAEINALIAHGTNLYAATYSGGFFISTDSGCSWMASNAGLKGSALYIYALGVDTSNIYAATGDGNIWRRPLSQFASVTHQMPAVSSLTSHPNPFRQKTTLSFFSHRSGVAQISIINLLGQEVARLFDGELNAGAHSFAWDAHAMPPGMYVCVVRRGGTVEQLPLVLMK